MVVGLQMTDQLLAQAVNSELYFPSYTVVKMLHIFILIDYKVVMLTYM